MYGKGIKSQQVRTFLLNNTRYNTNNLLDWSLFNGSINKYYSTSGALQAITLYKDGKREDYANIGMKMVY